MQMIDKNVDTFKQSIVINAFFIFEKKRHLQNTTITKLKLNGQKKF